MSTGKIGRKVNPREKVTPGYKQRDLAPRVKGNEDKLDKVLNVISEQVIPEIKNLENSGEEVKQLRSEFSYMKKSISLLNANLEEIKKLQLSIQRTLSDLKEDQETIITDLEDLKQSKKEKKGWL